MKESMHSIKNINSHNTPEFLIEESRNSIRTRGFIGANLEHYAFNFLIGNGLIEEISL